MMQIVLDILSWLALLTGCGLIIIGAVGLVRLPDMYTRMHAAGITDTLGTMMIMLGLAFQAGFSLITVKLGFIALFILYTSPVATHALARAAVHGGLKPLTVGDDSVTVPEREKEPAE
jgi:multicomponent Na+:H+ antiporter subunit G